MTSKTNKKIKSPDKSKTKVGEDIEKSKTGRSSEKSDQKKKEIISEIKARAGFIRISPRKMRLIISSLEGKSVSESLDYLKFVKKAAVDPIIKLINSAVANAENNFQLDKNDLYIKKIIVNDGPILKRWQPRAYGRSTQISKRTSHLELILGVKPGAKKITKEDKVSKTQEKKAAEKIKVVKPEEVKKEKPKITGKGPEEKGRSQKGFLKRIFSRKTG